MFDGEIRVVRLVEGISGEVSGVVISEGYDWLGEDAEGRFMMADLWIAMVCRGDSLIDLLQIEVSVGLSA